MIENASRDNALKRALRSEVCRIIADLTHLIPTNFVIVRCLKSGSHVIPQLFLISTFQSFLLMFILFIYLFIFFCGLKSEADPFMLAEVCSMSAAEKSITVHWWAPTSLSRKKYQFLYQMVFNAEMDRYQIRNRQRGAPMWKLTPKIQTIKYNMVYFGFSKMTNDSKLSPEVLRKLRDVGLIEKGTRVKRL